MVPTLPTTCFTTNPAPPTRPTPNPSQPGPPPAPLPSHSIPSSATHPTPQAPSVFNFYLPDYRPASGALAATGLRSPEAQLNSAPHFIRFLNGVAALLANGLSCHDGGFGGVGGDDCSGSTPVNGALSWSADAGATPAEVVNELDVLLTAGRLSPSSRAIVEAAYVDEVPPPRNTP